MSRTLPSRIFDPAGHAPTVHRWPALAFVALLLAAGTPAIPGIEAQVFTGGATDTTYGWTFPEGAMDGGVVEDAADDQVLRTRVDAEAPMGATPAGSQVDMLRVEVLEADAEILLVRTVFDDLQQVADPNDGWSVVGMNILVGFDLAGNHYELQGYIYEGCDATGIACDEPEPVYRSYLVRSTPDGTERMGVLPTRVDVASGVAEVLIPRWSLDRAGPGDHPRAGDTISGMQVIARAYGTLYTCAKDGCHPTYSVRDVVPDEGTTDEVHTLKHDSVGSIVAIGSVGNEKETDSDGSSASRSYAPLRPRSLTFDVSPEGPARVPLAVTNHGERKLLVDIGHEVRSGHTGILIEGPSTLEIPTGETRRIEVTVNGSAPFTPADPLSLRLSATAHGLRQASVDWIDVHLRQVPPLSPDQPRLYLHSAYEGGLRHLHEDLETFRQTRLYTNTLAEDPDDDGQGADMRNCCIGGSGSIWTMEASPTRSLALDVEAPGRLHLAIDSPAAGNIDLRMELTQGESQVASLSEQVVLEQGEQEVELSFRLREEADRLDPGVPLEISLYGNPYHGPFSTGGFETAFVPETGPYLRTGGDSWFALPFVEQEERRAGADHLVLDIGGDGDPARFVNPGGSTLWRVTVLNQADAEDTITLATTALPEDWRADLSPGDTFTLGAGESVTVGVRVTAPEDAEESALGAFDLTVASGLRDGAETHLPLTAVVTDGVAIEDEPFEADNETVARQRLDVSEESPSVSMVAVLAALGLLAAVVRRRR